MKIIFSILVYIIAWSCPANSQTVVIMEKVGGVYTVPCAINGLKTKMVFDTGASNVSLSLNFANKLYRSGQLQSKDFKGLGKSLTASGHIIENMSLNIRSLTIAGITLKNVDAIIIKAQNAPLLLGQSAIQRLGKITLTGNKLFIEHREIPDAALEQTRRQVENEINSQNYNRAIELLKNIEVDGKLNATDLLSLIISYIGIGDFDKSLIYGNSWIELYGQSNLKHKNDVYYYLGISYMNLGSYPEADKRFAEAIKITSTGPINLTSPTTSLLLSQYYSQKACNYLKAKEYELSKESFDIATQYRIRGLGYTATDLTEGYVKDSQIGKWLYSISQISAVFIKDEEAAETYILLSAMCDYPEALSACKSIYRLQQMLTILKNKK